MRVESVHIEKINKIPRKIKNLEKYYPTRSFSSNLWQSPVGKGDWRVIKEELGKVQIAITNRCNLACKICYARSSPNDFSMEMSKETFIKILRRIGRNKRVILIGGEPTIRGDIFELIDLIRKSGNIPEIYTNGIRLADFSFAEELVKRGVRRIYFSFDGFDRSYYEVMNGSGEVLSYKLLALKNLMKLNVSLVLSSRIVKGLNEKEIKKIIDFCVRARKRGKNIFGIYFFGATNYGRFEVKNGEMNLLHLFRLVKKATGGVASLEYFIEFKKFLLLLHRMMKKFGIKLSFGSGGLIAPFEAGSVKRVIEINKLKKINYELERGRYFQMLKFAKSMRYLKNIFNLFKSILGTPLEYLSLPSRLFFIGMGNISTPLNFTPSSVDAVELFEIKGERPIFVRYIDGWGDGENE